jgi:UDP-glucuronate 4-epimerase
VSVGGGRTTGRALVTGCAGFIGSHLTESLLDDGIHVVGVDCFNNNYGRRSKMRNLERAREWDAFEFVPLDLARGELSDVVSEVDTVFHLAAEPGVRSSWSQRFETYLRNNLLATHHLLDACRERSGLRFVYGSSSSIYGQAETLPTPESAVPRPFSPYGMTKLAAEHLCFSFRDNHGTQAVVLRYFSVYGPRQRPDMAFARFCQAILGDTPVTLYGDGTQTRDFTYVGDVVSVTRAAAEVDAAVGGVYNIGGGSRTSLREALSLLEGISGRPVETRYEPAQFGDVRDTGAATERARRDLGYAPATDLSSGLEAEFAWATEEARRVQAHL